MEHLATNFRIILIRIQKFSLTKVHLNMSSAEWWSFCPGVDKLMKQPEHVIVIWHAKAFKEAGFPMKPNIYNTLLGAICLVYNLFSITMLRIWVFAWICVVQIYRCRQLPLWCMFKIYTEFNFTCFADQIFDCVFWGRGGVLNWFGLIWQLR